MKEFQTVMASTENKAQLLQICNDTFQELNDNVDMFDCMLFFDYYYNLNFSEIELERLGRFIKTGSYLAQLGLHV